MLRLIRNSLSRLLAAPLAAAVTWFGVSPNVAGETESAVVTAATLVLYGLIHKGLDALGINPDDTAGG